MLDLLYAAANDGTGRRAALAVPTFGKTGTTQENRDALFIGFAGNLVVGVWVGRDDNKSLGKISGGTVPARDLAQLHDLGAGGRSCSAARRCRPSSVAAAAEPERQLKSPLPPEWSNPTKPLRDIVKQLEELIGDR